MAGNKTYEYVLRLKDRMSKTMQKVSAKGGKAYSRLHKAQTRLNNITRKFGPISNKALGVIGVASVGMFTTKIIQATKKTAKYGDEMAKMSRQIGMTAEQLQKLRFASERQGVSAQIMSSSLERFQKRLGQARAGTGPLISQLQEINPTLLNNIKNAENTRDAFMMMMGGMKGARNEAERAAIAQSAFGREGLKLARLSEIGAEGIEKLGQKLEETGGIMSNEGAKRAEHFQDVMTNFNAVLKGLRFTFSEQLMPIVIKYMERLSEWIKKHKQLIATKIKGFIQGVANSIKWLMDNMNWLVPVMKTVIGLMIGLKVATIAMNIAMMSGPWGWIMAAIAGVTAGIIWLITNWQKVTDTVREWGNTTVGKIVRLFNPIQHIIDLFRTMKNRWQDIKAAFSKEGIIAGFKEIGKAILEWMLDPIQGALEAVKGIIPAAGKAAKRIEKFRSDILNTEIKPKVEPQLGEFAKQLPGGQQQFKLGEFASQLPGGSDMEKYGGTVPEQPEVEADTETAKGISTGGRRQTNITISLGNLVETLNISQEGFEEATEDMQEQVTEALLRVLNSANQTANG